MRSLDYEASHICCDPILSLTLLSVLQAVATDTWTGKCIGVTDGDTITALRGTYAVKIRLHGIDTPERRQPFSSRARQFTAGLGFGKMVTVEPVDIDRYGRTVARIIVDSLNVNHELVRAGMAWWFRKYAPNDREFERLESESRKARLGLRTNPNAVPAWEWRKLRRGQRTRTT